MNGRKGDRIPGRRAYGGVMVVPCHLNGSYRCWLLVDTGAAVTALSRNVAEELDVDLEHPVRQERIASVHRMDWAPVVRIDSMQVGTRRLAGAEVIVLDLPSDLRVDGLLGVNFLSRFRPTFEFESATLILR